MNIIVKNKITISFYLETSSGILKIFDKISLGNCIFISNSLNKRPPSVFHNWFTLIHESHKHDTCLSEVGCLVIPNHKTKIYGRYSIIINAIYNWNFLQKILKDILFHTLKISKSRSILLEYFRSIY